MTYDNNDGPIYSVLSGKQGSCPSGCECKFWWQLTAGVSWSHSPYADESACVTDLQTSWPFGWGGDTAGAILQCSKYVCDCGPGNWVGDCTI